MCDFSSWCGPAGQQLLVQGHFPPSLWQVALTSAGLRARPTARLVAVCAALALTRVACAREGPRRGDAPLLSALLVALLWLGAGPTNVECVFLELNFVVLISQCFSNIVYCVFVLKSSAPLLCLPSPTLLSAVPYTPPAREWLWLTAGGGLREGVLGWPEAAPEPEFWKHTRKTCLTRRFSNLAVATRLREPE